MKTSYLIRFLLVVLCLVLSVSALSACGDTGNGNETTGSSESTGAGNTTAGEETTAAPVTQIKINVGDYALYIPETSGANETAAADALVAAVQEKLGAEFKSTGTDFVSNPADIDPNAYEFLIGATNRPESADALNDLGGKVGFVVKLAGNKLVINATAPALLDEAVQYFVATYVEKGASGSFDVPEALAVVNSDMGGVSMLGADGKFQYKLIYSDSVDDTETSAKGDKADYVVQFYTQLNLALATKFMDSDVVIDTDFISANADSFEILLGRTNRPETQTFLDSLKVNEYGYGVVGNKLVISGWSDLTIGMAVELFTSDLEKYVIKTANGENIVLTEENRTVLAYDKWNIDVPLYNAGKLDGAVELQNNSYQAYYINTTADEYKAYLETLPAAGYKAYQTNQIGNNLYATYISSKNMIHVYYVDYLGAVRLISESMSTAKLPGNTDKSFTKVTDMAFTMMDLDAPAGVFGNCFIITLEDGSFILNDGGGDLSRNTTANFEKPVSRPDKNSENKELLNLLKSLNKREDGEIVIAAWIISHQHWDHIKNAIDLFNNYKKDLKLERIIYNVVAPSIRYNTYNPETYIEKGQLNKIAQNYGADIIRMHTGQTIQIRNLKLEVLYTNEDIYPLAPEKFNNTSFVHRFDVKKGDTTQRFTIMGDIEEVASKVLVDMYGDELKTDIMQVAHHGYGGSVELYAKYAPSVVMWPKEQDNVNAHLTGTGYYPTINQSLVNQKNVVLVVVADGGHKTVSLPLVGLGTNRTENHNNFVTATPRFDGN